jgi:hypothetical protein
MNNSFMSRHDFFRRSMIVMLVPLGIVVLAFFTSFVPNYDLQVFAVLALPIAFLLALLILSIGISGLIGDFAKAKGRSWAAFFWLSILFSPLLMAIIVATIAPPASNATVTSVRGSNQAVKLDISREIEKLGELKEKGLITKAEFDAKKKELLDRI